MLGDAFAEASAVFVSAGLPVDALDEDAASTDVQLDALVGLLTDALRAEGVAA